MSEPILQQFLDAPVNVLLLAPIAYYLYTITFPDLSLPTGVTEWRRAYSWRPAQHPPTVLYKRYSPKTLSPFNGKDGARILLAINRTVFDVTAGRGFYGPGGSYGNFAGRDASRGMAKQSFDPEVLCPIDGPIDNLDDLTKDERDNMENWISHFSSKYIICGELVENADL